MSIRRSTVAIRAKTLNEVLAIGVNHSIRSYVPENLPFASEILKFFFEPDELLELAQLAALQKAATLKEPFNWDTHQATTDEIDIILADVILNVLSGKMTVPIAIQRTVDHVYDGLLGIDENHVSLSVRSAFSDKQNQTIAEAKKMAKETLTLLPRPIYVDKSTTVMQRMFDRTEEMEKNIKLYSLFPQGIR
jgi:hypothetical protein